jgi:hypothetical protein
MSINLRGIQMWGQPPSAVRRAKPGSREAQNHPAQNATKKKPGPKCGPGIQVGWLPGENLKSLGFKSFNVKPSRAKP